MVTSKRDWDVIIDQGGTAHKFRLLRADNKKAWSVAEVPPQPQIANEAGGRLGFSPDRELPFIMEDWSWGVGLDRFGSSNERGHVFRYSDGFGIDTTQPGIVKHGPLGTVRGSVSSGQVILQFIIYKDEVHIRTTNKLYSITGGTLTEEYDFSAVVTRHMDVFGDNLYIATDETNKYQEWDGTTMTARTITGGASYFLATQGSEEPILIRVYPDATTGDFNKISSSIDPTTVATWDITSKGIGNGDAINSLFTISGFVFAGTESTIFLLAADNDGVTVAIELDKRLRARRSTDAFTIIAESGSDAWLSDGGDIIRIVAQGFEIFDLRADGPFRAFDGKPVNSDIRGPVTSMAQDVDAVYMCVNRSGDIYVYKGVEFTRDTFTWTPLAKLASGTNNAMGVFKTTSDSDPIIYVGDDLAVTEFTAENWTTYTATWELETPSFTATLETWDKIWFRISAFLKLSGGTAKVEIGYKLDNDAAFTDFNDVVTTTNDMTADEFNELTLAAPINGKKIRLKFTGSNVTNTHFVNMRSFNLGGILRPTSRAIFDFTVTADKATEATFINGLRTDVTQLFTVTDRFDVARTVFILPGFPVEEELFDEAIKEPVRTYRIVAQEVV